MKKYVLSVAAVLMIGFSITPAVNAQDTDAGLVGSWTLSVEDSDFGLTPAPDSVFMTIERADVDLVMRRDLHFSQLGGLRYVTFDMPTDGGTYEATTVDGPQNVTVSWDGAELVLVTEVEASVGTVEVIDRYRADGDGRTLILVRLMDIPTMGVRESTMVFLRGD